MMQNNAFLNFETAFFGVFGLQSLVCFFTMHERDGEQAVTHRRACVIPKYVDKNIEPMRARN